MLITQIEGFLEIARQQNLSRAATALHVTQPALTARLRLLEEELGTPLFERSNRGMRLTNAGRAFMPYADRAIQSLDAGRGQVREHARGITGQLTIGTAPAVGAYVLPGILTRFVQRFEGVRLIVRTGHSEEIVEQVERNELDIGLIRELHRPGVIARPLYEDELILVVPGHHEFAGPDPIGVDRLADFDLDPLRQDVELLRPDQRDLPGLRGGTAEHDRTRQHRGSEAHGQRWPRRGLLATYGDRRRHRPRRASGGADRWCRSDTPPDRRRASTVRRSAPTAAPGLPRSARPDWRDPADSGDDPRLASGCKV